MKTNRIIALLMLCATLNTTYAQLPDGSTSPNIVASDILGNPHSLYDYLGEGKAVILHITATWASTSFTYHNSNALQDFYNLYGPDGTDEVVVLLIEAWAGTTLADFYGTGSVTVGDWATGTPFPIIDYDPGLTDFSLNYFPTIFRVCPEDTTLTEIGQLSGMALETAVFTPDCGIAPAPLCSSDNPVTGLNSIVDGGNVTLSWDAVPNSIGCRVKIRQIGTSDLMSKTLYAPEVTSVIFPTSTLSPGSYKWRTKCACSLSSADVTPNSSFDLFDITTLREGIRSTAIWPNPSSDFINIDIGNEGFQNYRLVNSNGKVVLENNLDGSSAEQIDVSELAAGTYYIELFSEQESKVEAIIISGN